MRIIQNRKGISTVSLRVITVFFQCPQRFIMLRLERMMYMHKMRGDKNLKPEIFETKFFNGLRYNKTYRLNRVAFNMLIHSKTLYKRKDELIKLVNKCFDNPDEYISIKDYI